MTAGIFCAVSGILVMALPVPIIGNNFAEFYREQAKLNRRIKRDKLLERRAEKERALAGMLKNGNCISSKVGFHNLSFSFFAKSELWTGSLLIIKALTTLQSTMNAKLSKHGFWHCHENGLIKTIQTIPHNLYVSVKLTSLYCGSRIILVYPNPQ